MKTIETILREAIPTACNELFSKDSSTVPVQFQRTRKEFEGDITVVVFPLTKLAGKGPEQTGEVLGQYLVQHVAEIKAFNVVKGFLNLVLAENYWFRFFESVAGNDSFGIAPAESKPRVIVEFASPNTNKPLHLGHLRNIFLGHSVSQILKANGHKVSMVQIINDRGIHICKSMIAWKKFGQGETPESAGTKGDKLVGKYYVRFDQEMKKEIVALEASGLTPEDAAAKAPILLEAQEMLRQWEAKDPEVYSLWQTMNGWVYKGFETSYATMGVSFDKLYYESDTYLLGREEVLRGLEKKIFFQKEDGSIWVDLTLDGLDQKALLRKDGTAMYITQDIGTAILRFKDFPDAAYQIYTVGNEQEYHFKVLFHILRHMGWPQAEKNFHLSYGMVELPEGKMKSREGTVVDADDLMEEMTTVAREVATEQGKLEGLGSEEKEVLYHQIGLGALKYFLLKVDPVKNMLFNPKESIDFNGNTGPFIQYAYVRTRAILRKAADAGHTGRAWNSSSAPSLNPSERTLLRTLHEFPSVVEEAGRTYNPGLLANYVYELTKEFNSFYHDYPILREEETTVRQFRLALVGTTGDVIARCMLLLGISMPDRM